MTTADHLDRSAASAPFREALAQFLHDGRPSQRIAYGHGCPPVKVERTLHKLMVEYPHLPIESIEMRAASGCEYFRGRMTVRTPHEERTITFHWDCKWRAEQEGWRDWFGFPDQSRAAREFGWDCFRVWTEENVIALAPGTHVVSAAEAREAVPA